VYCDSKGVNAFFVRDDLVSSKLKSLSPKSAYRKCGYTKPSKSKLKMIKLRKEDYSLQINKNDKIIDLFKKIKAKIKKIK